MKLPEELSALAFLSARIGADPLLIQAAGGNTSIKTDDGMWIKASGTQLSDTNSSNIFVPVDYIRMRRALATDQKKADQPQLFGLSSSLRPSIETSLHAVFDQQFVIHVHCVNTIAIAIRDDAETILADKLKGFTWAFVPYRKPGAQLAQEVSNVLKPETNVIVMGNHGLIVAGDCIEETEHLLVDVVSALATNPRSLETLDVNQLNEKNVEGYCPGDALNPLHTIAINEALLDYAMGGVSTPIT